MKRHMDRSWLIAAAAVLSMLIPQAPLHAATTPLKAPRGLAVDSHQNLYVANQNGNSILVYSSSYVQEKTITEDVNQPCGVAIDTVGNIYVLNRGNNTVTVYRSNGNEYPSGEATITSGIETPWGIALDGSNNLYVSNDSSGISSYVPINPTGLSAMGFGDYYPAFFAVGEYFTPNAVYGMAAHGPYLASGSPELYTVNIASSVLTNVAGTVGPYRYGSADEALSVAYDTKGNLYVGDVAGNLQLLANGKESATALAKVGFAIEGIAVDLVNGHIYLSNQNANQIAVYSLSGALITVIK